MTVTGRWRALETDNLRTDRISDMTATFILRIEDGLYAGRTEALDLEHAELLFRDRWLDGPFPQQYTIEYY